MVALGVNACYQESQVTMSGPSQLLLLVYDSMLRFLAEGKREMQKKNYEAKNTYLLKTQRLLGELIIAIDHSVYPELAANLDRLYRYLYDRLTYANIYDDEAVLMEVAGHLNDLRGAWKTASKEWRNGG